MVSQLIRWWSGPPTFRIYGKTRRETEWRIIDVYATPRRDQCSRWPFWRGCCITWSAEVIAVGCDFAAALLADSWAAHITRENPVSVAGGRFMNLNARTRNGGPLFPTEAEVLAHEVGHTAQALRFRAFYLPIVGAVTVFGEGPHWWNHFENEASEEGQFGGIVPGTVQRIP